jgi:hypothetical protein
LFREIHTYYTESFASASWSIKAGKRSGQCYAFRTAPEKVPPTDNLVGNPFYGLGTSLILEVPSMSPKLASISDELSFVAKM